MGITIVTLAVFVLIGFLPKVPAWAKLLIQVAIGLIIYFPLKAQEFPLPMADSLPMSSIFGGDAFDIGGFQRYSMGFIGTVLGVLSTAIGTVIGLIVSKKKEG